MRGMYLGFEGDEQMARMPQFPYAQTITEPWEKEEDSKTGKRGARARAKNCEQAKDKKSTGLPEQTHAKARLNGVGVESAIECSVPTWKIRTHSTAANRQTSLTEHQWPIIPAETTDMHPIAATNTGTAAEADSPLETGPESETPGQIKAAGLLSTEYALIEPVIQTRFEHPRVFVLMSQIACAIEHQKAFMKSERPLWVRTEALICRAMTTTEDMRRGIYAGLRSALALGLVNMREITEGEKSHLWSLTPDGKRFLLAGAKTRLNLQQVTGWGFNQICAQVSSEELELREAQILEQEEYYQRVAGTDQTRRRIGAPVVISRSELASAIQEQTLKRARDAQQTVTTLWAGLLR